MATDPRLLDAGPLVEQIQAWRESGRLYKDLSADSGVAARSIRRYVAGERTHVRLDCADRLSIALNVPLSSLYR
jgi:hypothetical protein